MTAIGRRSDCIVGKNRSVFGAITRPSQALCGLPLLTGTGRLILVRFAVLRADLVPILNSASSLNVFTISAANRFCGPIAIRRQDLSCHFRFDRETQS